MNVKTYSLCIAAISVMGIAACKTKKNTTTSTATTTTTSATTTTTSSGPASVGPLVTVRSKEGINTPGEEDLMAIQKQHPFVTMVKLNEGYELYAKTACLGCHNAKSIYRRDVAEWKIIIDDMAERAKLTETQKDAVYKYVLAMKATQPK